MKDEIDTMMRRLGRRTGKSRHTHAAIKKEYLARKTRVAAKVQPMPPGRFLGTITGVTILGEGRDIAMIISYDVRREEKKGGSRAKSTPRSQSKKSSPKRRNQKR